LAAGTKEEGMKKITLTKGWVALVDDEDFDKISIHRWRATTMKSGQTYANRTFWKNGKQTSISMHIEILGKKPGFKIDHRNNNGLDNRRENLRHCTSSQNNMNRSRWKSKKNLYKGVSKKRNGWRAEIGYQRKKFYGKVRKTEIEAATDYDRLAVCLFGEFAKTNFPITPPV
jgi:hypothetical protein